jgi:HlyD family secretion protein
MKKVFVILSVIFIVGLAIMLGFKKNGDDSGQLKFIKVKKGDISEKALAIGTIEPEKEIKVKSIVSGIIEKVYFKIGDFVKKGEPLFKISPTPTPLEYAEAKRQMEISEVNLNKIKRERDRKLKLYKSEIISASDMDNVESQYKEAILRYKIATEKFKLLEEGKIKLYNKNINSIIKAPISGIVLSQNVYEGDPVVPLTSYQPGTELCSMADMKNMLFKGTVDEIDVGKLSVGMKAKIKIGALPDVSIEGILERISPKAKKDGNSTLFDIEILIKKREEKVLRSGYSATAHIKIKEKKGAFLIPERLVIFENDKKFVEIMKNGKPSKKEIKTGLSDGLNIEVIEGLKIGEKIVERPPEDIK